MTDCCSRSILCRLHKPRDSVFDIHSGLFDCAEVVGAVILTFAGVAGSFVGLLTDVGTFVGAFTHGVGAFGGMFANTVADVVGAVARANITRL